MLVFRVECDLCENAHGPMYVCDNDKMGWYRVSYGGTLEPPQLDFALKNKIMANEYCGTTKDQFDLWWEGSRNLPQGWRISVYYIRAARVGTHQVLFERSKAKLFKTYDYIPRFLCSM